MAVLHSGNVTTKQARAFFNVPLRKFFLLPERSQSMSNVHAKAPLVRFDTFPVWLRGEKRNRIITGSSETARFHPARTQTRRFQRGVFQWREEGPGVLSNSGVTLALLAVR